MCTPSTIACTCTSDRTSATPPSPGSRGFQRRCALWMCVIALAPESNAWCATSASASECPADTITPRSINEAISTPAPSSSGATVIVVTGPPSHSDDSKRQVGRDQVRRIVRARPRRRQERPLDVHADGARHGARPAHGSRSNRQRPGVLARGRRHERRLERHHAGGRQSDGRRPPARLVGEPEVDPAVPVGVRVDVPGDGDPGCPARRHADRGHCAVLDCHVAVDELAVDQRGPHTQPHARPPPKKLV